MSRKLKFTNRYKKDFRRMERRGKSMQKLRVVLQYLVDGKMLPASYRNHPLKGDWTGHMECHIEPDWLLIYQLNDSLVYLAATGTHSDLFKK